MAHKGPHISIPSEYLVQRVLRIPPHEFEDWPEAVRDLAVMIAEELFFVYANPFIDPEIVRESVSSRWEFERKGLAHHFTVSIDEGITMFWSAHDADQAFKQELLSRLKLVLSPDSIDMRKNVLVECATDATDLRMELPLLVTRPSTVEEVEALVCLANEMKFALIPYGGGSGMTGGAVPARKRTVIISLARMNRILEIDTKNKILTAEAGAVTNDCIKAAAKLGLIFTVDPASKTSSTIGGNVSENSGGPFAFEYGVTIDNLLRYRMVTPTGHVIDVERVNHPRHKIREHDTAVFEVRDINGKTLEVISLNGETIRTPGLGKDVTNKALGGLPGVQKEGTDGIIISASFVLYDRPKYSRVMALEFFGRSMSPAVQAIRSIVAFRERLREAGRDVKISALEEFNSKYVQAIEYRKKSTTYEGMPISVLILQIDGNDEALLDECVHQIRDMVVANENVDAFIAHDEKEAERFWEDRHRLSAIARRTSGFKINEDIVIPIDAIPAFADFMEQTNLECMAAAYRAALQEIGRLPGLPMEDKDLNREFSYASRIILGKIPASEMNDEELLVHSTLFLKELRKSYPKLANKIDAIEATMHATRIVVASHMHAGDGNCHVNIPVNSNDPVMLHNAETVAHRVMKKAQELGGEVSGEHGIGITKIAFLSEEKMAALRQLKERVDPLDIMNPAKLVQREPPAEPYTFSFNRLIKDIRSSGLANREMLTTLLSTVQSCTRCGKCKQFCAMFYPERSMLYYPRNKNMTLGALVEAIYYSQSVRGVPDQRLLEQLRTLMDHCTACGKCSSICPVKISSQEVALIVRAYLQVQGQGGHPIKSRVLAYLAGNPSRRVPFVAKMASMGQSVQNQVITLVPRSWRRRFANPLFTGPGPLVGYRQLNDALHLNKGAMFLPKSKENAASVDTVLYFPGCGGSLFYRNISLAGFMLLLRAGFGVVMPKEHLCCGYPLLAAGADEEFQNNKARNIAVLKAQYQAALAAGLNIKHIVTACGSCRDGLSRYDMTEIFGDNAENITHKDVGQLTMETLTALENTTPKNLLFHPGCHASWSNVNKAKAGDIFGKALSKFTGNRMEISPGCCGESGMGAMTTPEIYNKLRARKEKILAPAIADRPCTDPIIVACPSCKLGITRTLMNMREKERVVVHVLEYLAECLDGKDWSKELRQKVTVKPDNRGIRIVDMQ